MLSIPPPRLPGRLNREASLYSIITGRTNLFARAISQVAMRCERLHHAISSFMRALIYTDPSTRCAVELMACTQMGPSL